MPCAGCSGKVSVNRPVVKDNRRASTEGVVVEKSNNPQAKVRIRYYGGGTKKSTGGCHTCHGSRGGYVVTTAETIQFVSEDSDNELFKMTFNIGHDYYVTDKQAEYLCSLTYRNRAGQIVNKFQRVEED